MGGEIIQSNWHIVKVSHGTEKLSNEIELENKRRRKRDVLMMMTVVIAFI